MEIKLKNKNLSQKIANELNCDIVELNQENLCKITSLDLVKENIFGEELDNAIEDLVWFPNLKELTISLFEITNYDIDIINSLKKLQHLNFDFCKFSFDKKIQLDIKYLYINNCLGVRLEKFLCKELEGLYVANMNDLKTDLSLDCLEEMETLCELELNNYKLNNLKKVLYVLKRIKKINFDGSIIDDVEIINELESSTEFSMQDEHIIS